MQLPDNLMPTADKGPDRIYPCSGSSCISSPLYLWCPRVGLTGSEGDIQLLQGKEEGRELPPLLGKKRGDPRALCVPWGSSLRLSRYGQCLLNYLPTFWFASSPPKSSKQEVIKFLKAFSHALLQSSMENWKPFVNLRGRYFHWNFRDLIYHLKPSHFIL